jgi:hypothetical protein
MSIDKVTRRAVLRQGLQWPAVGLAFSVLNACDSGKTKVAICADPNALSATENALRMDRHYVEQSTDPAKACLGCGFFKSVEGGGACGECAIFQGPANAKGHCDSWAAKHT